MKIKSTIKEFQAIINIGIITILVSVPLAIWKVIDILLWIADKIIITIGLK